jgi:indole-3-acetate monooxygenase
MTPEAKHWTAKAAELAPLIRDHAEEADRNARLSDAVAEALQTSGLNRVLLPRDMGGGGLTLPEMLPVIEELAKADASAGWTFAICGGGPLFGMRLAREAFHEIFSDPGARVAGSLAPTGRAVPVDGGYRFSGLVTFASGAWNASWLRIGALVFDRGRPRVVDGNVQLLSGVFPMSKAERTDSWNPVGMRGTGSIDCRVDDVFVPEPYTFNGLVSEERWDCGAFGVIPLPQLLGAGLAAVAVGTAAGAIDLFCQLAATKVPIGSQLPMSQSPVIQSAVAEATGLVDAARATLQRAADEVWQRGAERGSFDPAFLAHGRLASVTAARLSRRAVEILKEHAGTSATNVSSPFGRAWRDVDTVATHIVLSPPRLEIAGRAIMGLPVGAPFI